MKLERSKVDIRVSGRLQRESEVGELNRRSLSMGYLLVMKIH